MKQNFGISIFKFPFFIFTSCIWLCCKDKQRQFKFVCDSNLNCFCLPNGSVEIDLKDFLKTYNGNLSCCEVGIDDENWE